MTNAALAYLAAVLALNALVLIAAVLLSPDRRLSSVNRTTNHDRRS